MLETIVKEMLKEFTKEVKLSIVKYFEFTDAKNEAEEILVESYIGILSEIEDGDFFKNVTDLTIMMSAVCKEIMDNKSIDEVEEYEKELIVMTARLISTMENFNKEQEEPNQEEDIKASVIEKIEEVIREYLDEKEYFSREDMFLANEYPAIIKSMKKAYGDSTSEYVMLLAKIANMMTNSLMTLSLKEDKKKTGDLTEVEFNFYAMTKSISETLQEEM